MKFRHFLSFGLLITALSAADVGALPVEGYRLVWSDEFDGEDFDVVAGTFTRGKAACLVSANDSYEHPATFRMSAAKDLRIQSIIASWNAKLPDDLNVPPPHGPSAPPDPCVWNALLD